MTPLIAADVARNTVLLYGCTLTIASVNAVLIAPKAYQVVRTTLGSSGNGETDEWTSLQKISRWRVVLLLAGAVLYQTEAINSLVYFISLWRTDNANSITLNIVRLFTVTVGGPLSTVTTTLRISIILATKPVWRVWLIKSVLAVAGVIVIVLESVFIRNIIMFWDYDIVQWQNAVMVPSWIGAMVILLTLWCIGGSLVSLKLAFSNPKAVMPKSRNSTSQGSDTSATSPPQSGRTGAVKAIASDKESLQPQQNPTANSPPAKRYRAVPKGPLSDHQVLQQSLNLSFKFLTVIMTICWILFILFMVYDNQLLPVRGQAVRSLCACLVFAAESMFEPIFHKSKVLTRNMKKGGGEQGLANGPVGAFTLKTMVVSEIP